MHVFGLWEVAQVTRESPRRKAQAATQGRSRSILLHCILYQIIISGRQVVLAFRHVWVCVFVVYTSSQPSYLSKHGCAFFFHVHAFFFHVHIFACWRCTTTILQTVEISWNFFTKTLGTVNQLLSYYLHSPRSSFQIISTRLRLNDYCFLALTNTHSHKQTYTISQCQDFAGTKSIAYISCPKKLPNFYWPLSVLVSLQQFSHEVFIHTISCNSWCWERSTT